MPATEPRPIGFKPPWRYRALTYRIVIGVVAVALLAGAVAWWIGTRPPRAESGEVVQLRGPVSDGFGDDELPVAATTTVATPADVLEVTLGEPASTLPPGVRADDGGSEGDADDLAPRDGSFLPVRWRIGAGFVPEPPVDAATRAAAEPPAPVLTVVVDGEVVVGPLDVGGAAAQDDAVALAVTDEADISVQVTFDGVTQTVDARTGELDAGVAQAYYDIADAGGFAPGTCGIDRAPAPGVTLQGPYCVVEQAEVSPWRPGAGWVEQPGQAWVGVTYRWILPNAYDADDPSSRLYTCDRGALGTPRLADREPDELTARRDRDRCSAEVRYAGWVVDEVPRRLVVVSRGEATYRPILDGDPRPAVGVDVVLRLSAKRAG